MMDSFLKIPDNYEPIHYGGDKFSSLSIGTFYFWPCEISRTVPTKTFINQGAEISARFRVDFGEITFVIAVRHVDFAYVASNCGSPIEYFEGDFYAAARWIASTGALQAHDFRIIANNGGWSESEILLLKLSYVANSRELFDLR